MGYCGVNVEIGVRDEYHRNMFESMYRCNRSEVGGTCQWGIYRGGGYFM